MLLLKCRVTITQIKAECLSCDAQLFGCGDANTIEREAFLKQRDNQFNDILGARDINHIR